jgi:hypothetical protein
MPTVSEMVERLSGWKNKPIGIEVARMLRAYAESADNVVKAREMLEQSGAKEICDRLAKEMGWRTLELGMRDWGEVDTGLFVQLRGRGGGNGIEWYEGEMILVGACVSRKEISVYSKEYPHYFRPLKSGKWGSIKKMEKAIKAAASNPGAYRWMEGMMGEECIYKRE